ncbi:MAG: YaeQ family protein [Thiogranum sp.]|nr:YaeQ family protein [Thiogranum sp.]
MALKATIFKSDLNVIDVDRNYYQEHALTLARHPSETDERMMMRLLAFARHAGAALEFTRGISSSDEPDLWSKNLTGEIDTWIEVGQPDDKRLRKACHRASQVLVYTYSGHAADLWWQQVRGALQRFDNLTVFDIAPAIAQALARLAQRSMQLQCTIQDGQMWLSDGRETIEVNIAVRE